VGWVGDGKRRLGIGIYHIVGVIVAYEHLFSSVGGYGAGDGGDDVFVSIGVVAHTE